MTRTQQSSFGATLRWAVRCSLLASLATLAACDGSVDVLGRVVDDAGEPIASAKVRLGRPSDSFGFDVETDTEGCFNIGGMVSPGVRDYNLDIEAPGREPYAGVFSNSDETRLLVTLVGADSGRESSATRLTASAPELEPCP